MAANPSSTVKPSRSLVFSEGTSNKFWKIELDGKAHTVVFGRIGTAGQTKTNEFATEAEARKSYDKLVAEKTKKGYADADSGANNASADKNAPAATIPAATSSGKSSKPKAKKAASPESESNGTPESSDSVVAAAATPTQPAVFDLNAERSLGVPSIYLYRATFRNLEPLDRGTPREFDLDSCLTQLSKLKTSTYGWDTRWNDLQLPAELSRPEAHFWLIAMTSERNKSVGLKEFAETLRKKKFDGNLDADKIDSLVRQSARNVDDWIMQPVANLITAEDYIELLVRPRTVSKSPWQDSMFERTYFDGLSKYVLPYLTTKQRQTIRKSIQANWDTTSPAPTSYGRFPVQFYLAALFGISDLLGELISQLEDDHYSKADHLAQYERPHDLVLGLASPEHILAEWRRLKLKVTSTDDIFGLLACTEYAALGDIAESIIGETNKEKCEELLSILVRVRAPEAAEPMLNCKLSARAPIAARDWLDTNLDHSVPGLIATAGGRGKLADAAMEFLRGVKRAGHSEMIANSVKQLGKSDAAAKVQADVLDQEEKIYAPFDAKTTPSWLDAELKKLGSLKRKSVPKWANAAALPPLVVGERRLNDQQMETLIQVLAATPVTEKHSLLTGLREHVTKLVRDEFAWKLFQLWIEDGCPSKEKWAMGAMGHLGDDSCVLKMTPMIRVWPGESQHARAVFGLECLRAIGSNVALMNLSGIAQKLKFKGLKGKAEQFVTEIATERGLTRDELEDRVVPDCGLDEYGRREFSFGPRSFSFVLGGDLKAMVRDEAGKLRPNLPDPGAKDDATKASESVEEWKLLKKQIKEVATIQASRLEQAMVTGRRWSAPDFQTLLVRHPLMTHLAQKLIWAGFNEQGERVVTFRVTEERDLANPDDEAITLDEVSSIGLVHPLELDEAERSRWGEVLGDYEVVPPFPQLGRAVYGLEPGEAETTDLARFAKLKLVAPTLVFTLEKMGWIRGIAMDAGCFDEHSKQFPAANITAVVHYSGTVGMGYIDPDEMLDIESIHFCAGIRPPSVYGWESKNKLKLKKISRIVISEVIADLQVLKSKAK